MFVFTKKDIYFCMFVVAMLVVSIAMPLSLNGNGDYLIDATVEKLNENVMTVVVDAGHGEPDGGAVSADGVKESDLNLQIAKKLAEKLEDKGYKVVMTRSDANNVADESKQKGRIRDIKVSDLNNRVKMVNESGATVLVSIHMNKFEDSKYRGWQTFYSKNSENGKLLAENIQASIGDFVDYKNTRTALKIDGIKIIDKSTVPAVIVECGFLSNVEECKLLQDGGYQDKLASGICIGIEKFFE